MPLYFFDVYNDEVTLDEEGQELPGPEAARDEAIKSARALICDAVREGGEVTLSHRIDVADADRRPVLTIRFGEVLQVNP